MSAAIGGTGHARNPRPELTPEAAAVLGKGPAFLVAEDNLLVPIAPSGGAAPATAGKEKGKGKGKAREKDRDKEPRGVPFLAAPPKKLEILSVSGPEALIFVDGDVWRLRGTGFAAVGSTVGASAAASEGGAVIVGIEDKKQIKITTATGSRVVRYRRPGRWELESPWVSPDGKEALVTLRDLSNPNLDEFCFLALDPSSTADPVEVVLSKNFAPGPARRALTGGRVLLQMFAQSNDEDGVAALKDAGFTVFDWTTRKLGPAPEGARPGLEAPTGKHALVPGVPVWGQGRECSGDETLLAADGKRDARGFDAGEGTVVSAFDFLPDGRAVIANVLDKKTCKNHGVLIPLDEERAPSGWPAFPLPVRPGRMSGRVLPQAMPEPAAAK